MQQDNSAARPIFICSYILFNTVPSGRLACTAFIPSGQVRVKVLFLYPTVIFPSGVGITASKDSRLPGRGHNDISSKPGFDGFMPQTYARMRYAVPADHAWQVRFQGFSASFHAYSQKVFAPFFSMPHPLSRFLPPEIGRPRISRAPSPPVPQIFPAPTARM